MTYVRKDNIVDVRKIYLFLSCPYNFDTRFAPPGGGATELFGEKKKNKEKEKKRWMLDTETTKKRKGKSRPGI